MMMSGRSGLGSMRGTSSRQVSCGLIHRHSISRGTFSLYPAMVMVGYAISNCIYSTKNNDRSDIKSDSLRCQLLDASLMKKTGRTPAHSGKLSFLNTGEIEKNHCKYSQRSW